jgi:hypothetical protein
MNEFVRPGKPASCAVVWPPVFVRSIIAVSVSLFTLCAVALADARHLSQMPDPRGEFIRLCAPFMVSRYAHPEAICDCLRSGIRGEIGDVEVLDTILYGITEQGVPSIDPRLIAPPKRLLIDHTLSQIAGPTMECMFGSGKPKEADKIPKDGLPTVPPPLMDVAP